MSLPDEGPCQPWVTWAEVVACRSDLDAVPEPAKVLALDAATSILFELTGKRYPGECETTRSFCQRCGCARDWCSGCGPFARVDLGALWPVSDVISVTVEGEDVDASKWRVDDWRWLVRLDGETWPLATDLTEPDAFQVTWVYGRNPSPSLRNAAALFTAEVAAKCASLTCGLPDRVTTVNREGVTYTILDPQRFIAEGRTGIYLVDLAVEADKRGRTLPPGGFNPARAGTRRVATGTDAGGS